MKKIMVIAFLSLAGINAKISAQQPAIIVSDETGWHKIAETKVNYKTDKDEIMVMGKDRFSTLIVKVTEAPVELLSIDIHFDDGTMQKAAINKSFVNAGQSDVIKLTGGERSIKKIVFVYKTITNPQDKNGHVEVWGLKKNTVEKNK